MIYDYYDCDQSLFDSVGGVRQSPTWYSPKLLVSSVISKAEK